MPRTYRHVKGLEEEIFIMKAEGKTNREIRELYGLSKKQMANLITRHNRREEKKAKGIIPLRRGRPPKDTLITDKEKDYEIKRLRMENQLLRDFLRLAGRR